jgi:hypothetical protein
MSFFSNKNKKVIKKDEYANIESIHTIIKDRNKNDNHKLDNKNEKPEKNSEWV